MCMCVCLLACSWCVHVRVRACSWCMCVRACISACTCVCVYVRAFMCVCMHVYVCIYLCVCMHACACVYVFLTRPFMLHCVYFVQSLRPPKLKPLPRKKSSNYLQNYMKSNSNRPAVGRVRLVMCSHGN